MPFIASRWNGSSAWRRVAMPIISSLVLVASLNGTAAATRSLMVSDTFSRHIGSGWLVADRGGSYSYAPGNNGFDVDGRVGRLVLGSSGAERLAELPQLAARDVNLRFRFYIDQAMSEAGASVVARVRVDGAGTGYEARVSIRKDRSVWLSVSRERGGVAKLLGSERRVPDTELITPGWHWLRVRATGAGPTRLQARLWAVGQRQPRAWQVDVTDSDDVATSGGVSVGAKLSASPKAPVQFKFDDLVVSTVPDESQASPSPAAVPAAAKLRYVSTPQIPMPGYLAPIVDPTWGTQITRIYNEPGVRNSYSRRQSWSVDGKYILLYPVNGDRVLLRASDYSVYRTTSAINSGSIWSNTLANAGKLLTTGSAPKDKLLWRSITDDTLTTIHTFTGYTTLEIGDGEGNLSDDDSTVVLQGRSPTGTQDVIVYDMVANRVAATKSFGVRPNNAGVSHSGRYVVVQFRAAGTGANQGTWLYDRNLTQVRQLSTGGGYHFDFAYDTAGNEVVVSNPPGVGGAVIMQRLSDGRSTTVLGPGTAMVRGHISGRNIDRPGWVYCSIYDSTNTSARPGADQVFALKLDGSQTVEVFAQAHHGVDVYANDPMASVSRDGRRVIFGSEWGGTQAFAFVAQLLP